jgi:hypothetical protein
MILGGGRELLGVWWCADGGVRGQASPCEVKRAASSRGGPSCGQGRARGHTPHADRLAGGSRRRYCPGHSAPMNSLSPSRSRTGEAGKCARWRRISAIGVSVARPRGASARRPAGHANPGLGEARRARGRRATPATSSSARSARTAASPGAWSCPSPLPAR